MKYQFIQQHRGQYAISLQCRVLEVSVSGFCAWCKRSEQEPGSDRERANQQLTVQIRAVFHQHRRGYGSPRIYRIYRYQELHAQGVPCSRRRVARLMRQEQLRACCPRRHRRTTDSNYNYYHSSLRSR